MMLVSMVFIWLGVATLLTIALCLAASGPMPKPDSCGPGARHVKASRRIGYCDRREAVAGRTRNFGHILNRTESQN